MNDISMHIYVLSLLILEHKKNTVLKITCMLRRYTIECFYIKIISCFMWTCMHVAILFIQV